jgi:cytochrome c oxidase subunit I
MEATTIPQTTVKMATVAHPRGVEVATGIARSERRVGWLFACTGLALFSVLGLVGLTLRLTQAGVLGVSPRWFYRLMTLHGSGMLVGALLGMMGALWFVLRPTVALSLPRVLASYAVIMLGAVAVVVSTVVGGFAAGWTFLSPLPFHSAGQWSTWATVTFLVGNVLVGVGFFIYCLDVFTATIAAYGGLRHAVGLDFLRDRDDSPPPPQAIAAVVVSLEGMLASAVGTTILLALIEKTIDPQTQIDALWAKNLTYFYGHTIANLIIYIAAGMIYVLVPLYCGRQWKTSKPIVIGWMATLVLVTTAYSHHLYMDFVQPRWAEYVSEIASYTAAVPVAVVTIYTGMMLVWGSRYRWTLASTLLYLGFAGWAIGGTGAVIDSIIPVNFRFHNTLWVPAHFHTYLLLGVMLWLMAFFIHLLERAAGQVSSRTATVLAPALMVIGGYGLVGAWYASGALGVPRRYAVHPPGTESYSLAGSIFAMIFAAGFLVLLLEAARLARVAWRRRIATVTAPALAKRGATERASLAERTDSTADHAAATGPGRLISPLRTPTQVACGVFVTTVALTSLFPQVIDASEASAQYHHLDHAAQFFLGAMLAVMLVTSPALSHVRLRSSLALGAVIVAPAAMLLAMTPSVYTGIVHHPFLHFIYHLGMVALGFITGIGLTRFGAVTGRVVFVLSIGMAAMFAAGVSGG